MNVYIAGPMRGIPDNNHPAFDDAKKRWTDEGHRAFSPACLDRAIGWDTGKPLTRDDLEHMAHLDLACIHAADAIALLPGWENSVGVTMELALAQFLGIPVYDAVTMEEIHPMQKPWALADSCRKFGDGK